MQIESVWLNKIVQLAYLPINNLDHVLVIVLIILMHKLDLESAKLIVLLIPLKMMNHGFVYIHQVEILIALIIIMQIL